MVRHMKIVRNKHFTVINIQHRWVWLHPRVTIAIMSKKLSCTSRTRDLSLTAVALQDHIARDTGLLVRPRRVNNAHQQTSLTLAQRLGLVEKPTPLLTETQWAAVRIASSDRGDSLQPCPICQDEFKMKSQILLSCSHTFHKSCLLAFERFSGKKHCPLCRHPLYQTKVISTASQIYKEKAVIRIQSSWRGYRVRKWYKSYRETHPPTHPGLKRKYYERKLSKVTDKLVESCTETCDTLDSFFASIDDDVRKSRQIWSMLDNCQSEPIQWDKIMKKARQFESSPCVVCLTEMNATRDYHRSLSVLSCSHLLHTLCVSSLELYSQSSQPFLCPICRNPYVRSDYS